MYGGKRKSSEKTSGRCKNEARPGVQNTLSSFIKKLKQGVDKDIKISSRLWFMVMTVPEECLSFGDIEVNCITQDVY